MKSLYYEKYGILFVCDDFFFICTMISLFIEFYTCATETMPKTAPILYQINQFSMR